MAQKLAADEAGSKNRWTITPVDNDFVSHQLVWDKTLVKNAQIAVKIQTKQTVNGSDLRQMILKSFLSLSWTHSQIDFISYTTADFSFTKIS